MRILHLPVGAGKHAWGQAQAERRLGHQSDVVVFENHFVAYPCDRILFSENDGIVAQEFKRWLFFLDSIFRYDVFHFHYGQKFFVLFPRPFKSGDGAVQGILRICYWAYATFVGKLDLRILRMLGKSMVMTYHGDDIRQGDRCIELYRISVAQEVGTDYYDVYSDRRKRKMARVFAHFVKRFFVVTPDLIDMSPPGTLMCNFTGIDFGSLQPASKEKKSRPLVIHAPTHRLAKGTRFIEQAVRNLKAAGYDFDFLMVEKMNHIAAQEVYRKADLAIDQLLAGWFGLFAVEMMALGTPVIAYVRDEDLAKVDPGFAADLPIINAEPSTIESQLAWCLDHLDEVQKQGATGRKFAIKWYDADKITAEVAKSY